MNRLLTLCCLLLSLFAGAQEVPDSAETDAPLAPTAYFQSNAPVCFGTPVCFTDFSVVASPPFGWITTWVWDFGDGTTQTITFPNNPNVCHSFPFPGTYIVTLTVTDNYGTSDDHSEPVIIRANPIANFMFIGGCDGQQVQFMDLSQVNGFGYIVSWQWDFGDPASGTGNISNLPNPSHLFSGPGSYDVTLSVTTNYSCSNQIIKPVYIAPSSGCITKTWTGAVSDDWSAAGNWNPSGVPSALDNILIPAGLSNMPKIKSGGYSCNDLTILENATLTINPGMTLTVNGKLLLE